MELVQPDLNNLTFRWSAFPIAHRKNAQRSTTTLPLFPVHSRKSIFSETARYLNWVILDIGRMKNWIKKLSGKLFALLIFVIFMIIVGLGARWYLFDIPCCLELDCQGYGIGTEQLKYWEEQEKRESQGILDIAGRNTGGYEEIQAVATGRKETAQIIGVYGNMKLAFPARILSGVYDTIGQQDACVLSAELADALFGSLEVEGESICFYPAKEREKMELAAEKTETAEQITIKQRVCLKVAGVIDAKGKFLLAFAKNGEIEILTVRFKRRFQAEEKLKQLIGSY